MTRSLPVAAAHPPVADTRKRIRSTTGFAAAAATVVATVFGVVFAQPDTPTAAAETAPEPVPTAEPGPAGAPDSVPAVEPAPAAPRQASNGPFDGSPAGSPAPARQPHHVRQAPSAPPKAPAAPRTPPQPAAHARGPAVVTSGAS